MNQILDFSNIENQVISFKHFGRKFPRLDMDNYPQYHNSLIKLNRLDLSWRIHRCRIDGIGLECENNYLHSGYVPVSCNRRTCPQCAWTEMLERLDQFYPLVRFTDSDMILENPGYRLRFWTLTAQGIPKNTDLTKHISKLKSAFHLFWRKSFGNRSQFHDPEAGGVFFLEVQGKNFWCPHIHGLAWTRYPQANEFRSKWEYSLKRYGLKGNRIQIKLIYGDPVKSIFEIISYPIRPNKNGRHDQKLLAHTEVALSGQRRYFIKGSFYRQFPRQKGSAFCHECDGSMEQGWNYIHNCIDYQKNIFSIDYPGIKNFIEKAWISPARRRDLIENINIPTNESLS